VLKGGQRCQAPVTEVYVDAAAGALNELAKQAIIPNFASLIETLTDDARVLILEVRSPILETESHVKEFV
jgi:hypothetical protein